MKANIQEKREEMKANIQEKREEIKSKREEIKAKYKKNYEDKYKNVFVRLNDEKRNTLVSKIDWLVEKVTNWNYSDETKEKLLAMLEALKEVANNQ